MELLDLLFELIAKHVPLSEKNYHRMRDEATAWRHRIQRIQDGEEKGQINKVEEFYVKANEPWYYRLGFAVAFVPLSRWIMQLMDDSNPLPSDEGLE